MIAWIDIEKQKPVENKAYLVYRQFFRYPHIQHKTVHVATYFPELNVFNLNPVMDGITHWAEIENLPNSESCCY